MFWYHRRFVGRLLFTVLLVLLGTQAEGQQTGDRLGQAIAQFQAGKWESAVTALEQILSEGALTRPDRSRARKFLGFAYMSLGNPDRAVAVFKEIVRDDPGFDMDALTLEEGERPPAEAVRHFGQAVVEVRQEEMRAREARLKKTARLPAMLRSAALPGWGQWYLGYQNRGYMMLGAAAVSLGYAVWSETNYRSARSDYRAAPVGANFDGLHSVYVTKADRADMAWGMFVGVWAFNVLDAWIQGPNLSPPTSGFAVQGDARSGGFRAVFYKGF